MRIGIVAPPWLPVPPPGYGGIESAVDTLAVALQAAGNEVVLAASDDSTCPVERLPGFPPADPTAVGSTLEELRHVALAYPQLTGVDVIHDHTLAGPLYRNRPPRVPVAATVHGPFVPAMLDVYRAMSRDVSLVAISHSQAATAAGVRVSRVIHHAIQYVDVPVGAGRGGYACFLGRMDPSKGVLEAIRIARIAGIPLRIAAKMRDHSEHDYFTEVIRPLLGPSVEFIGELGTAEKYDLLGGALALVNPLQWAEPFGMVMIESLAAGTPVVATPRGSAPEIVDDGRTGYLRDGEAALVQALQRAGELDRGLCRMAVEERFGPERMASEHLELYRRMLGGNSQPQASVV
ncbi:glycosyltransferase family 4 protein [Cryobacterium tepidiphilum]|uniref:Glycosyltransferase family 4 protein n=1 Tax=Cryobacterium tepidiphilum TaxID=2486026 RepID=A0A3M8L1A9_9MICO|nr:glycosyltransferase family 4 protein [Cryobacterium tepidiphilum]RNE59320.1 glycosyltransferase family 4 protein [Cryobacterium tepidiphilum]